MKTYNVGSGSFYVKRKEGDCYCPLGILMAERGYDPREIVDRGWVVVREDLFDDVAKMAEAMRPALPEDWRTEDSVDQVYTVNDAGGSVSRFDIDVIQTALKAVDIEVELIDKRDLW